MVDRAINLVYQGPVVIEPIVVFATLQAGAKDFLLFKGISHVSAISNFRIRIDAALTGATKYTLAVHEQNGPYTVGPKVLDNLFDAEIAVPSTVKEVEVAALKSNEFLSLGMILGETSSDRGREFDLVLSFDAAVTNTAAVGLTIVFDKLTLQEGVIPATGKTVDADVATPATN